MVFATGRLLLTGAVHQFERLEQGRGHGNGRTAAGAALLQALEGESTSRQLHPIGAQRGLPPDFGPGFMRIFG